MMRVQRPVIDGKRFVLVDESEYERLRRVPVVDALFNHIRARLAFEMNQGCRPYVNRPSLGIRRASTPAAVARQQPCVHALMAARPSSAAAQ